MNFLKGYKSKIFFGGGGEWGLELVNFFYKESN